jgi:hypothetical protein
VSDDDDLRINTLHRFAKHSPRIILHEYSHCEVPAGCGGVVLRWIAPEQGSPAELRLSTLRSRTTTWFDGDKLETSLFMLKPGGHVVAVHLRSEDASRVQPFTFQIHYDRRGRPDVLARSSPVWRAVTTRPPDDWSARDFDDRGWPPPPLITDEELAALDKWPREYYGRDRAQGMQVFAVASELWLRVAFIAPEDTREETP